MTLSRAGVRSVAPVAFILAAPGCARSGRVVVYDLASKASLAERESTLSSVLFGTAAAEPVEGRGFYREGAPSGDSFAWVRRHAQIDLTWPDVVPRAALLDLGTVPGLAGQSASVALNGVPLGSLELAEGRHRYRVGLPAEAQRPSENALTLSFAKVAPATNPHAGHLAARLYSLTVAPLSDLRLEDLLAPGAPPPLSVRFSGGAPEVLHAGPGLLRYAFRLPEEAELRVTPGLHETARAAGASVGLRLTLEDASGVARVLWDSQMGPRDLPREVALRLPGRPGDVVRLGLEVKEAHGARFAWAVWGAPRILGRSKPPDEAPGAERRADALRTSLIHDNVLLVILDAASAKHFSCYGYPRQTTPEIDRIAAEGVVFERAHTPAVFTLAAMSSTWTSQYPDQNHEGVAYDARLPPDRLTLAELLSAHGIASAGFVANGMAGSAFGLDRGFSEFHEIYRDLGHRGGAFLQVVPPWFERHREDRFFAYLHVREPHFPYDPAPPYDTRFGPDTPLPLEARAAQGWYTAVNSRRKVPTPDEISHLVRAYDGNLAFADHVIGSLRQTLEEKNLWDRTVVIVAADHGEALFEHGFISHGLQLYVESTWIPLIIHFPRGVGPAGVRLPAFADLLDLAPTIADVFGLRGQGGSDQAFHGRSLLPVVFGAPGKPVVFSRTTGYKPQYSVRDGRALFIFNSRYGQERLFDLSGEPGEQTDVLRARAVVASYYRQTLQEWMQSLVAERGTEAPAKVDLPKPVLENLKALGYVN